MLQTFKKQFDVLNNKLQFVEEKVDVISSSYELSMSGIIEYVSTSHNHDNINSNPVVLGTFLSNSYQSNGIFSFERNTKVGHAIDQINQFLSSSVLTDLSRKAILLAENGPFEGFENPVKDTEYVNKIFPAYSVWWTDLTRTKKIVEKIITYNTNRTPNNIQYKVYDYDGITLLITVTDTIIYNGIFEISRNRSITYI